jgi:tRNA(Arg) A34 adenosine deaminase TadA
MTERPEPTRRDGMVLSGAAALALFGPGARAQSPADRFIAEAFRLRDEAAAAGDQPYGAVLALDGWIVGRGRSRVVSDRNADNHAERMALRDAQTALGRQDMSGAVIYSSSVPCLACQAALARANVSRMIHGQGAADAGAPRAGG